MYLYVGHMQLYVTKEKFTISELFDNDKSKTPIFSENIVRSIKMTKNVLVGV